MYKTADDLSKIKCNNEHPNTTTQVPSNMNPQGSKLILDF